MDGDGWDDTVPSEDLLQEIEQRAFQRLANSIVLKPPTREVFGEQAVLRGSAGAVNPETSTCSLPGRQQDHRFVPAALKERKFPGLRSIFLRKQSEPENQVPARVLQHDLPRQHSKISSPRRASKVEGSANFCQPSSSKSWPRADAAPFLHAQAKAPGLLHPWSWPGINASESSMPRSFPQQLDNQQHLRSLPAGQQQAPGCANGQQNEMLPIADSSKSAVQQPGPRAAASWPQARNQKPQQVHTNLDSHQGGMQHIGFQELKRGMQPDHRRVQAPQDCSWEQHRPRNTDSTTSGRNEAALHSRQPSKAQAVETKAEEYEQQQHHQPPGKRLLLSGTAKLGPDGTVDFELPYHEQIRATLTKVPHVVWMPGPRVWRAPANMHDQVLRALQGMPGMDLRVEGLHDVPYRVLKATASRQDDSERYSSIPQSLQTSLMKFQQAGVRFALRKGTRVLIGDEMGLGKTVQAVALLSAYSDKWPAVIITPSSLKEQWADALHQWLGITERRLLIVNAGKDIDLVRHIFASSGKASRDFLILSYNFVSKMKEVLADADFQIVVLDECHSIKDPKAQRTKDTVPIVQQAEHAVLLSGTPMVSRPKEMLTQLSALVPEAKLKMKDFGERYCLSINNRFSKYDGCINHEELNKLLITTVMVRRLKKDVLDQLPPKRRQQARLYLCQQSQNNSLPLDTLGCLITCSMFTSCQVFLKLDKPEKDKLDKQTAAMEAARSLLNSASGGDMAGREAVVSTMRQEQRRLIMDLYRLTAELKVKVVQQYLEELLEQDQKLLVFCHHKVLNDAVVEVMNRKKVQHICIDGSVPPEKRQGLVNKFQLDHRVKVAVLSIKAAGVGLTLTAASIVVFAELAWSPGDISQAEDRAHRIGQPSSVNVYFLHVKHSIDDIMWSLIQSKLENVGQAINGCKDTFDMESALTQRAVDQASLRGFLQPISMEEHPQTVHDNWQPSLQAAAAQPKRSDTGSAAAPPRQQKQASMQAFFKPTS